MEEGKMKTLRRTATTAAVIASLTTGAAIAAEPARDPTEMLLGQYACSTFPASGPQAYGSLMLNGTSGLFVSSRESGEPISMYADLEAGGVATCDAFAAQARTRLQTIGCTASQITVFDPNPNNSFARRSVRFVCSGPRDKMVDSLARLVELIVTNER
jgi:putative intracellular protease/amidase